MKTHPGVTPEQHRELTVRAGIQKIFCFKDEKSETYGPPMTVETQGVFIRQIQEQLPQGQAIWSKHPQDFSIFELGEYDIYTGKILLHESKKCLGLVMDFRTTN